MNELQNKNLLIFNKSVNLIILDKDTKLNSLYISILRLRGNTITSVFAVNLLMILNMYIAYI